MTVCAELENPIHVITKAPLVERDIDLLSDLASRGLAGVTISVPFWNADHARRIEPGVATPQRRVLAIERLARAGIPVSVNVAPVIPGLTDCDIPKILEAAAAAGAGSASMNMLRLPGPVQGVFFQRLEAELPLVARRVRERTLEVRGGQLNDARFGSRMKGEGHYAEAIRALFETTARRVGLAERPPGEMQPRAQRREPESRTKCQLTLFQ